MDAQEPNAEFVIKFEGIPTSVTSKTQTPAAVVQNRASELERLLERLRSVPLQCTTRAAPDESGNVLIFIRASTEVLQKTRWHERVHDLVLGVGASQSLTASASLSPAERLRYTYLLVTGPTAESARASEVQGAGVRIRCADFPHVMDMMPLHDAKFDRAWIQAWSNVSAATLLSGINYEDITYLRDHMGEEIALYFAFLNYYFKALAPAGALGLIFWACGQSFHPMYAILLVVWATVFFELWKIRERVLAVRWGMTGVARRALRNASFQPSAMKKDKITGERTEVFEEWRRELRIVASLPIILCFILLLLTILTLNFLAEVITAEVYDGPGKNLVPFVPTMLYSTSIPLIMMAWTATAKLLTKWENHATMRTHNGSLTLKLFGMQSLVTYAGLVLTAYVYIPFGERIILELFRRGYLTEIFRFFSGQQQFTMPKNLHFKISPERLHSQLFALCVSEQIMNTVSEVLVPIGLRLVTQWHQRYTNRTKPPSSSTRAAQDDEASFLARVQSEFKLPVYDTFVDYAEMMTQFGTIVLWSVIWPLAPTIGFINNFFELRSDTVKLIVNMRRPIPLRRESIGSWLNVMMVTLRLGVFTNATLVYLFQNHQTDSAAGSTVANFVSRLKPMDGPEGALVAAFLCAVLCDRVFGMVQLFLRYILQKYLWENSEENLALRRVEHLNRVSFVERLQSTQSASPSEGLYSKVHDDIQPFWDPSRDNGLSVIQSAGKRD